MTYEHSPPFPQDEVKRLQVLHEHALLDTSPEERFDRITRLAQQMFGTQIALVSLVDAERQWFKSRQGLDACETGRDISFCGHAILNRDIFHIADAGLDPRFADNPLVTGPPHIRFYAGAPLATLDGYRIGTLCIIDSKPRQLTVRELASLRDLADCVEAEINRRHQERQHEALLTMADITSLSTLDPPALLRAALALGCSYLGMAFGIISRIEGDDYEITIQSSPAGTLRDGEHYSLAQTYCSLALQADDLLAIDHMAQSEYATHPCYRARGFESYIGIPLRLDGAIFGTLNFSSAEPHTARHFAAADFEFIRLLARWVTATIEHWKLNQNLQQQQQLRDTITRAQSKFISTEERQLAFDGLLTDLLALTRSAYGFIGEVLRTPAGEPYLKTHAISNIAWDDATRAFYEANASSGLEFFNLKTLFGAALSSGEAVIANAPEDDPRSGGLPKGHPALNAFLGIPVHYENELVAMVGLANRPGGYNQAMIDFLRPLLLTIAQLVQAARTQKLLYESEERHRLTLSSAKLAAWDWDIASGRVSFNERWAEMRGHRLQDIEPHIDTWKNGIHSADMPNLSAQLEEHFAGRTALFEAEYRALSASGMWIWLLGRGAIIGHDVKGAPARVACTEIDITERKHMERMKSEFVSTVSHELRTPLTAISGSLGLITGGVLGQLPEQIMQLISIAHKNSLRLSFLINDLLDMEKLEAGKMHFDMLVQPLMPLIEQALEANRPYGAERRVALMLASGLADACVSVDSQRLMQVLSNLLSNAIKYSPQDGRVEIAVEQRDKAVRVSVSDHGPGIPVEFRARIFQKFAQADSSDTRQKGGTGLGLAITRELVERMGGSIGFDSVAGEGAVFYFEFPLCTAPA